MAYDEIQVNTGDIGMAAAQFANKAAELEQMLQQVQSQIMSLSSTWKGPAASNFNELMGKWTTDVQGINEVLNTVSQHLTQAATNYQDVETGIASSFQQG